MKDKIHYGITELKRLVLRDIAEQHPNVKPWTIDVEEHYESHVSWDEHYSFFDGFIVTLPEKVEDDKQQSKTS